MVTGPWKRPPALASATWSPNFCPVALTTLLSSSFAAPTAVAQASSSSWSEVKCARYKEAWLEGLARRGRRGLGREFLDRHEAFLASGCRAKADVCLIRGTASVASGRTL